MNGSVARSLEMTDIRLAELLASSGGITDSSGAFEIGDRLCERLYRLCMSLNEAETKAYPSGLRIHLTHIGLDVAAGRILEVGYSVHGMYYAEARCGSLEASDRRHALELAADRIIRKAVSGAGDGFDTRDLMQLLARLVSDGSIYRNAFYALREAIRDVMP